jgi:hypothetical protein
MSAIDWLFRNRQNGEITIVQIPNIPLGLFLVASVLRWLFDPSGGLRSALGVLATVGLVWWAIDEVLRGVNPWRRILGGTVLAGQVLKYLGA